MPDFLTMMMTRGQRKLQAELTQEQIETTKQTRRLARSQEARLWSQEQRAVRLEPYLKKQIDVQIENWQKDNAFQITKEENDMFRAMLTASTAAAKRGDIDAANQITKMMKLNFPQYKGVGEIIYEPGKQTGEYRISSLRSGKGVILNQATGEYQEIDISDEETPVAAEISDKLKLAESLQKEMKRLEDKWETDFGAGLVEAAAQNEPEALVDAERYRKHRDTYDDLMAQLYGGGEPAPQAPPSGGPEAPSAPPPGGPEAPPTPPSMPAKAPQTQQARVKIVRAALPVTLRDKEPGTYVVLKDGRVLLITTTGGEFLTKEEAEGWKAQRAK